MYLIKKKIKNKIKNKQVKICQKKLSYYKKIRSLGF